MNKKIYFNHKNIEFAQDISQKTQNQGIKIYNEIEHERVLKEITDHFKNEDNNDNILILNQNFEKIFEEMKKYFHYIEAAGGFIKKNEQFLCIHRHGRWDLPKGKLEKGETIEEGAIRECEEECGIKKLSIVKQLSPTFHVYPHKKGIALKQSYWYLMASDYDKPLKPQTEEDIDEVRWFMPAEIRSVVLPDTYFTISDVIAEGLAVTGL
jgi:8-oxo-dGTP pyrophosphatase MutT (NUDIX family)